MIKINVQSSFEDIDKAVVEHSKTNEIEFDIVWTSNQTKEKIFYLVNELLIKHNIEKYSDDILYILMELVSNAVKARYFHIITVRTLRELYPDYNFKIDTDEYLYDIDIMNTYSDIVKDPESKQKLRETIRREHQVINDLDNNIDIFSNPRNEYILSLREKSKKKMVVRLLIKLCDNSLDFIIVNDAPLIMIQKTRIDSKRLTFKQYYLENMSDKFFLEQLDHTEGAGFGLALCDLRLYKCSLCPDECLKIYGYKNKTYSQLSFPIKN